MDWNSIFAPPGGQNIFTHPGAPGAGGLLGFNPYQEMQNIGAGLLMASGPSREGPVTFGGALGKGLAYAGERRDQGILNEARRMEIGRAAREEKGYLALADWAQKNPELAADPTALKAATLQFAPELAAKAMLSSGLGPLEQLLLAERVTSTKTASEKSAAELAETKSNVSNISRYSQRALDAARYLKTIPGGESIATLGPEFIGLLRKGKAGGWDKTFLGEVASYGLNVPKDKWGQVLDAAEAMDKARAAIANAPSNQAGVAGLQNRLIAQGATAGLNLQEELFADAVTKAEESAAGFTDYELPKLDPSVYPWRGGERTQEATTGGGFNPAATVPPVVTPPAVAAPPPVTVSPPAPAQAAAVTGPAARKVQTQTIDPATGNPIPTYPRKADGARAVKRGKFIAPNAAGVPTIYEVY